MWTKFQVHMYLTKCIVATLQMLFYSVELDRFLVMPKVGRAGARREKDLADVVNIHEKLANQIR